MRLLWGRARREARRMSRTRQNVPKVPEKGPLRSSKATATFRVHGTAHEITFQIDTGTQCNVIPFSDYVTATGDENGVNLLPTNTVFIMHNKATNKPKGTARLVLDRNGQGYDVFLYVVQGMLFRY